MSWNCVRNTVLCTARARMPPRSSISPIGGGRRDHCHGSARRRSHGSCRSATTTRRHDQPAARLCRSGTCQRIGSLWPASGLPRSRCRSGLALTDTETQVLRYLPTHLTVQEIARELWRSTDTIKTHVRHLYVKLDAHTRSEAVRNARASGSPALRCGRPSACRRRTGGRAERRPCRKSVRVGHL